jgi:hypothetical protein
VCSPTGRTNRYGRAAYPVLDADGRCLAARLLLDKEDRLAAPLMRDGDPELVHIEETDANFTIEWKGHYRIEGDAFIYVDGKTGGTRAILGYPTQKLEQAARSS